MSLSFSLWFTEHWLFFTSPPTQKLNFTLLPNVRSQRTPIQLHLGYLRVNHPSCRSQLLATCRECALQFKCDKWGSERHSLPPADGKQNQSLFVPGTLSFKMRMGPIHVFLSDYSCARYFNPGGWGNEYIPWCIQCDNMEWGKKEKIVSLLPPTIHMQNQIQWTELGTLGSCHYILQKILSRVPSWCKYKCLGTCNSKS